MASSYDHHATGDENGKETTGEHKSRHKTARDRSDGKESRDESKSRSTLQGSARSLQSMNSTESGRSRQKRRHQSSKSSKSLSRSRRNRRDRSSKSSRSRSRSRGRRGRGHAQSTGSVPGAHTSTSVDDSVARRKERGNEKSRDRDRDTAKERQTGDAANNLPGAHSSTSVEDSVARRKERGYEKSRDRDNSAKERQNGDPANNLPGAHSSTSVDDSATRRKERGNGKSRDRDRNDKDRVKRDRQNGDSANNLPGAHSSTSADDSVARRKERGHGKSRDRDRNAKERVKRDQPNGVHLPGAHSSTSVDDSVARRKERGHGKSGGRTQGTSHAGAYASTSEDRRARRKEGRENRDGMSSSPSEEQKVEEGLIVMNGETLVAATTVEEVMDQQKEPTGSNHDTTLENQLNESEERAEELRRQFEDLVNGNKRKRRLCFIILFIIFVLGGSGAAAYFGLLRPKPSVAEPPEPTDTSQSPTNLISSEPSDAPSNGPTEQALSLKYPLPSEEDCQKIANGAPLDGQETLMDGGKFFVLMDVELSQEEVEIEPQLPVLEEQIRKLLLPRLAGCRIESTSASTGKDLRGVRRLQAEEDAGLAFVRNVIANGSVEVKLKDSVECEAERPDPCHVVEVILDLSLLGPEKYFTIIKIISEVFQQDGNKLKATLQLGEEYTEVTVRTVGSTDPTPVPSISPSATPSVGPTLYPTATPSLRPTRSPASAPVVTDSPTDLPSSTPSVVLVTNVPTKTPSKAPTKSPTKAPTPKPTTVPFPGATPLPTSTPSTKPSISPSSNPSSKPSSMPSFNPSSKPSTTPSSNPSSKPSTIPSSNPSSNKPSVAPSAVPSLYPSSNRPSAAPSVAPSVNPSHQPSIADWIQLGSDIDGEAAGDLSGSSVSLSSDGKTVAIGSPSNDVGADSGYVRVYSFVSTQWVQLGSDIDGLAAGYEFGLSVALSSDGKTVAIGDTSNDDNGLYSGHVRVYSFDDASAQWVQLGSDIGGEAAWDLSGSSVSLSSNGKTVAIGADANNGANGFLSGHVRVYTFGDASAQWVKVGQDIDGEGAYDRSGRSVSLSSDGKTVAIGAPEPHDNDFGGVGHVRVYSFDDPSTEWRQVGSDIDGETWGCEGNSGTSVSLSSNGKTVAIGDPWNEGPINCENSRLNIVNSNGHVRVYTFDDATAQWVQVGQDIDGEASDDMSGWSVSLSSDGKTVVTGAPGAWGLSCKARVYTFDDASSQWVKVGQDIDGEAANDRSGFSVSLSSDGKTVAIGAPDNADSTGHVRVFRWP